ncbi:MAG: hypothetical protein WBW62_07415 [Solirubrobacterales bacterium]
MAALVFASFAGAGQASADPGEVDPAFGQGGTAIVQPVPAGDSFMNHAVPIGDGGTLTAGGVEEGSAILVKRNAAGLPDASFGAGGLVEIPDGEWRRVSLMDDGRIVAFGRIGTEASVARFLPNGSLDPAFGTGGIAQPEVRSFFDTWYVPSMSFLGAGVDSQGRPVAALRAQGCDLNNSDRHCDNTAMVRLQPNGQIDPGFGGGDGVEILRTNTANNNVSASVAVLAPDDSLVVAGAYYSAGDDYSRQYSSVSLGVYSPDGKRRLDFGGEGVVSREVSRALTVNLLEVDGAGKITVSAGSDVLRFKANGKPDRSFGVKGRIALARTAVAKTSGISSYYVDSAAFDEEGRLYMGGIYLGRKQSKDNRRDSSVVAVRFTTSGGLDPTFSSDGINKSPLGEAQTFDDYYDDYGSDRGGSGTEAFPGPDGEVKIAATTLVDDQLQLTLTAFQGGTPPVPECKGTPATVMGTKGPDDIVAGDVTFTGAGNDRIRKASGIICSGGGRDTISGGGTLIYSGAGNDVIDVKTSGKVHAGAGNDHVTTEGSPVTVFGDAGDDRITAVGVTANDTFFGGPGKDYLDGSWGHDRLDGGPGPDRMIGSRDDDRMFGRAGNDILKGGGGTDTLIGGPGRDKLDAGPRGPKQRFYRGKTPDGPLFLKVQRGKFVFARMPVKSTCTDGDTYTYNHGSVFIYTDFKGSKGKFVYDGSYTDPWDGSESIEDLKGRLTAGKVTGRYRDTYDQFRGPKCFSGKGYRNAWIKFHARRLPDPKQVVKQGGR